MSVLLAACGVLWFLVRKPSLDLMRALATDGPGGVATQPFPALLTGLCSWLVLLAAVWVAGSASLVGVLALAQTLLRLHRAVDDVPSRVGVVLETVQSRVARVCPALARRLVLLSCGVALGGGLSIPLAGAAAGASAVDAPVLSAQGDVSGLELPDRTVGAPHLGDRTRVTAGDSLWSIVSGRLRTDATDAELTHAWHALYRANHVVIGADPNKIIPGTSLRVPPLEAPHRKEHS